MMKKLPFLSIILSIILSIVFILFIFLNASGGKDKVTALYIPLADHYAGIIAYDKYKSSMKYADYEIIQTKGPDEVIQKFKNGEADLAFIPVTVALNEFSNNKNFKLISLLHRDGNAFAINQVFVDYLKERGTPLKNNKKDRKPTGDIAKAFLELAKKNNSPTFLAIPSLTTPHILTIYQYFKNNNIKINLNGTDSNILIKIVSPPQSPNFLKLQTECEKAASFEQSLPWPDIIEAGGYGKVAFYSKDIFQTQKGHVECIIIANINSIKTKKTAIKEVIQYIHKAGSDIDEARQKGGDALLSIAKMINTTYIKTHSTEIILSSLDKNINAINYSNLNPDKEGIKFMLDLALESGIIKNSININEFIDENFIMQ